MSIEYTEEKDLMLNRLATDMWYGSGKDNPPVTVRMSRVEDNLDRVSKNLGRAIWLFLGVLLTALADMLTHVKW